MKSVKRIILATDLTHRADRGLLRALDLRREWDCELLLVHVIPSRLPSKIASSRAHEARTRLGTLIRGVARRNRDDYHVKIAVGDPASELARLASECRNTLLMAGQHGRAAAMGLRHSTTLLRFVACCPSPVLVVGNTPTGAYRRPIAALSLGCESRQVLAMAVGLVPTARLPAVHAYDDAERPEFEQCRDGSMATSRLKQTWSIIGRDLQNSHGREIQPVLRRGSAVEIIRQAVHTLRADLLVIGRHTRSIVDRPLIGSVARELLWSPPTDLLITGDEVETVRMEAAARLATRMSSARAA